MTDVEVGPHVTVLTGAANGKYPDGNSVLIEGSDGTVLIDPSLTVHDRGGIREVDRVLISHAHEDHIAGLSAVRATHIHAHHDDVHGVRSLDGLLSIYGLAPREAAEFRVELATTFHIGDVPNATGFDDDDVFDLGDVTVRVLHLPGHTRGHSAFVIEPDGVAFVGDVDLSSFGPYYGDHWSDLEDFVASIATVRELDARHYVTFHHKGVVSGRDEFVRQLDAFGSIIGQRDERLVAMLDRPRTFAELVHDGLIYRPGTRPPSFGDAVERRSIELHLARLRREGVVVAHADGRFEAA
ncbi:MAG: beta-lactamase domain protein [Ilumatobacteraceae bacterium]|nr:beta-lactamase domain protein [Ilumatobacteraceae bacterium]